MGNKLGQFVKGKPSWNKGTKGIVKPNKTSFKEGHSVPQEWRDSWSRKNKGRLAWNKGKYCSKKTKEKISESLKGRIPWNKGNGDFIFNCRVCNKKVLSNGKIRRKIFCSKECFYLHSHIMRGENHWNYKGENNHLQRYWSQYKEWRKKVLKKDNYICVVCRKKGGNLQVHHIKSFAKYPKLRFKVSNGNVVHRDCHLIKLHKWNYIKKQNG
jgi:hypothetical protein